METQRTLLADLAEYFIGPTDPRERLDALRRDRLNAEAEIREVLGRLGDKYRVPAGEVDEAMTNVGLAVDDMIMDIENDLLQEIELSEPVENA